MNIVIELLWWLFHLTLLLWTLLSSSPELVVLVTGVFVVRAPVQPDDRDTTIMKNDNKNDVKNFNGSSTIISGHCWTFFPNCKIYSNFQNRWTFFENINLQKTFSKWLNFFKLPSFWFKISFKLPNFFKNAMFTFFFNFSIHSILQEIFIIATFFPDCKTFFKMLNFFLNGKF